MKQMVKMVAESCWPQYKFAKCSPQVALLKFKKTILAAVCASARSRSLCYTELNPPTLFFQSSKKNTNFPSGPVVHSTEDVTVCRHSSTAVTEKHFAIFRIPSVKLYYFLKSVICFVISQQRCTIAEEKKSDLAYTV